MSYSAAVPYGAAAAPGWGQAPTADPYAAYAQQQYYAAYGYPGYDYSSYYQHQAQAQGQYPATAVGSDANLKEQAPVPPASSDAAPPPPPPSGDSAPAPPGSPAPPGTSSASSADRNAAPPPPPDDPPPPPGTAVPNASSQPTASTSQPVAAAPAADPPSGSYDAAYAQWYAQTYGTGYPGYSYPGYDAQQNAYWHAQQANAGYPAYCAPYGQPQPPRPVPGPTPPKGNPPPHASASKPAPPSGVPPLASAASHGSSSGLLDSFNAQPPPPSLYSHQPHHHVGRHSSHGLTGANTIPIGPRPPPGDPPAGSGDTTHAGGSKFRGPAIIRPQMPGATRATAAPAYISVGSSKAGVSSATPSIAAEVAAAAAGAAAAAAAAKAVQQQQQPSSTDATKWPPSFAAWVTRCFNTARLRSVPDAELNKKLMSYLEEVKSQGRLWTTDWDTHPVMLPDGLVGGGGEAASGPLSPSGPQGRKRSRWGDPPEQERGREQYRSERTQDADTDEEDYGQYDRHAQQHGRKGSGALSPRDQLYNQPMSNRKRKKLLALEARQQQRGGGRSAEEARRAQRAGRFGDGRAAGASRYGYGSDDSDMACDDDDDEEATARRFGGIVVGTCQKLEKSYFRLTSQPDPASVRPEPVLDRALERLVGMIARGEATYFYALDQFKGMRQDCTVQHLRNALAVRVYEAHARSSLEYGDTAEFNQCQARLGHLYAEGQPGCLAEFTAYRLLYETVHCAASSGSASSGSSMARALLHTMRNVPRELAGAPEVRHALQVREAVMTHNYAAFFRLYATAPHLGRAIMDVVAENVRWQGLNAFVKACDLPVPVPALAAMLGFMPRPAGAPQAPGTPKAGPAGDGSDAQAPGEAEAAPGAGEGAGAGARCPKAPLPGCQEVHLAGEAAAAESEEAGVEACAQWLRDHGAVVVDKGGELQLDCKGSRGKLFIPEVPAKVAHGDENLSLTDFLSRAKATFAEGGPH